MQNKRAFTAGCLVGITVASVCAYFLVREIRESVLVNSYRYEFYIRLETIRESVRNARLLQTSNITNALESCESNIDWAVKGLAWLAINIQTNSSVPQSKLSPVHDDMIKAIGRAKAYRDVFPRQSSDQEVSSAFTLVQTNH